MAFIVVGRGADCLLCDLDRGYEKGKELEKKCEDIIGRWDGGKQHAAAAAAAVQLSTAKPIKNREMKSVPVSYSPLRGKLYAMAEYKCSACVLVTRASYIRVRQRLPWCR